jgi:hypothetical protein
LTECLSWLVDPYVTLFWIPAIAGAMLLVKYSVSRRPAHRLDLLAALLTVKPIVATPIWLAIVFPPPWNNWFLRVILGLLPGAGLTGLIVIIFRPLFSGRGITAPRILLAFDCIRWLNSFLLALLFFAPFSVGLLAPMIAAGLFLPSIYAAAAIVLVIGSTAREQQKMIQSIGA